MLFIIFGVNTIEPLLVNPRPIRSLSKWKLVREVLRYHSREVVKIAEKIWAQMWEITVCKIEFSAGQKSVEGASQKLLRIQRSNTVLMYRHQLKPDIHNFVSQEFEHFKAMNLFGIYHSHLSNNGEFEY